MVNKFLLFFVQIWDLLILVPSSVKKRVEQEEHRWVKTMGVVLFLLLPAAYIAMFYLVDYNKPNIKMWATFRFGLAFAILTLGIISYFFRRITSVIIVNLYITALLVSLAVSWSMSFVPGYVVQSKWVVMVSAFVLLLVARGLIIPVGWLFIIITLASPLWSGYTTSKILLTDTMFAVWLIIIGYSMKKIWIQSKVNQFLRDDSVQEAIQQQIEFDNEMKRFISPVLVRSIEEKTRTGQTLVMALDDVLMRKEVPVAVMFTDLRNFSTRSVDIGFVEQELVPTSSKIIDAAEENMGVAKQIGDAVFVYYSMKDPEEGLLRAIKDSVKGCLDEQQRIRALDRTEPERFFSIAYGVALVGNMASFRHREATVIGSPANLSSRIDSLTKEPAFKILIDDGSKVIVSEAAKELLQTFNDKFEFIEVNLEDIHLTMKSFPDETRVYLFSTTSGNLNSLNEVLVINNISTILC